MNKKIILTGAKGRLSQIILQTLTEYDFTLIDLPELDLKDYDKMLEIFLDHDAIVHLAWDSKGENWKNNSLNLDNIKIACNVYKLAMETKIPKVIMMSSIHADSYLNWSTNDYISVDRNPTPDSPYGVSKIFIEKLGQYYASNFGLKVVCPRIGGVNGSDNSNLDEKYYNRIWLSKKDFCNLIKKGIEVENITNNFCVFYGVSNNKERMHDTNNEIGWQPE